MVHVKDAQNPLEASRANALNLFIQYSDLSFSSRLVFPDDVLHDVNAVDHYA